MLSYTYNIVFLLSEKIYIKNLYYYIEIGVYKKLSISINSYRYNNDIHILKSEIRKDFAKKRDALSGDSKQDIKDKFCKNFFHILDHIDLDKYNIFAGYVPIRNEIDISDILKILSLKYKKVLCLPSIINNNLKFFQYNVGDTLVKKNFGTYETNDSINELTPDFVIIPMLSFDSKGTRLGFGKGFYDRFIANLRNLQSKSKTKTIFCGCAYSFQEYTKNLPCEEHDQPLDFVITECCVHKFK